uniref:Uncharacterized protein n=1 Tax=Anguilla anguilla TaxID=7936 RepID=A0A0E9VMV6_ANGAN
MLLLINLLQLFLIPILCLLISNLLTVYFLL